MATSSHARTQAGAAHDTAHAPSPPLAASQSRPPLNAPDDFVPASIPRAEPLATADPLPVATPPGAASPLPMVAARPIRPETDQPVAVETDIEPTKEDQLGRVMLATPPWLVSLAVHMLAVVVLGLLLLPSLGVSDLHLEAVFSETFGEQLEEETFSFEGAEEDEELTITPADLTAVEDPLATPPNDLVELNRQALATASFESPKIGLALSGREPGMKDTLLLAYGGNKTTEGAVAEALRWLAKNQRSNGTWSLKGPYQDGAGSENRLAATSMALLAFQGAGFTPKATRVMLNSAGEKQEFDYRRLMQRGWDAMLRWQDKDGSFWKKGHVTVQHHVLYSQAQATIAICELYAMTRDDAYRRYAQRAVDYAVRIHDSKGGWRYHPGEDSDTSVTGWFVMALQSARMAGLDVPSDVFEKISRFLDSVTNDGGSRYGYMPGYASKLSMTAEALLCRQYLGWPRNDERLQRGVAYLANNPIDWSDSNTYYWYYATQVMHHMEGDPWIEWNRVMAKAIPAKQVAKGPEKGSWSTDGDRWAMGGRLYMTCLCTYMLEVYYRHLPIYANLY